MACLENICNRLECGFHQYSNQVITECPLCGDRVMNFLDEPDDNESPIGDGHDEIDFDE